MMRRLISSSALPAFLFLCLLAGGSRQGIWAGAALQLLAVIAIAWAAVASRDEPPTAASRQLLALAAASVALVLFQLVPLPPAIWTGLPGRETIAGGFALLGYELPWLPLSMAPYETLDSAYAFLPALAALALTIAARAREAWVAGAIVAGAIASVLLGAAQVTSSGPGSWAYLYEFTNVGAVGFFANRNHVATLLLAAIPFAGALIAAGRPQLRKGGKGPAMVTVGVGGLILLVAGLALNGSLAGLALAVPVVAMTVLIFPAGWRFRGLILPVAGIAVVVSVFALKEGAIGPEYAAATLAESELDRTAIWRVTAAAIGDSFPFGTGLGTFPYVYALQEDPAAVIRLYANHAHNDYLELILEAGLGGLLLAVLFLAWFGWHSVRVWRSPFSTQFARAATIASGAILAHSIVDYPLRTAAISALLAACAGIIAQSRGQPRPEGPKHVRIA